MTYDVIHFEALGAEAAHLKEATALSQEHGCLPKDLKYLITPDTVQNFLEKKPEMILPNIISTKTHSVLPKTYLDGTKKSIITRSAGYDHYEALANRANIASLRNYCVGAVSQTAIKFMYATLGLLNEYMACTKNFERNKVDSFMEISPQRVATVFGVGNIGKRIYDLVSANGLYAQAVDIRQNVLAEQYNHQIRFVSKEKAMANSDVIINAMNLTRIPSSPFYNANYFSESILSNAKPGLCFINVTRGEIAPESGLLKLYDKGIIAGLGLDVFTDEEAFSKSIIKEGLCTTDDCAASKIIMQRALDHSANMYVQPHQGFNSDLAVVAKAREAIHHLEAWYRNNGSNFDEQLPYYRIGKIPMEALV
ncbi:MAG: NAD(P)-dependent oxidoreductase [Candidatus Fimivivens sp.]